MTHDPVHDGNGVMAITERDAVLIPARFVCYVSGARETAIVEIADVDGGLKRMLLPIAAIHPQSPSITSAELAKAFAELHEKLDRCIESVTP